MTDRDMIVQRMERPLLWITGASYLDKGDIERFVRYLEVDLKIELRDKDIVKGAEYD